MKRLTIIGISFIIISLMFAGISDAKIDPNAIVGVWLFDGDEDDIDPDLSGNNHDGTINGDPERIAGKFGQALNFDGGGDFVDCGNDDSLSLGVFTVSFWANMPETQGWNHMVSKGSHVAGGTPGSVNWGVMVYSNEEKFLFEVFEDTGWRGLNTPISLNEWHHVVATYDGDKMELLIDGESKGTNSGVKMLLDASRSFRIGGIATAGAVPGNFFNGSIDEVALFNVALTVDDVQDIMNDGLEKATGITAVSPSGKLATTWSELKK
jgi:hypothetical protein